MPLIRSTHANAREEVARLEAEGEVVTAIATDDGGVYIATSKPAKRRAPGGQEAR